MSTVSLSEKKHRQVFEKLVAQQKAGHTGDIVPREFDLAEVMARSYPAKADGSVPPIEMK